jgi:hypothetical protein
MHWSRFFRIDVAAKISENAAPSYGTPKHQGTGTADMLIAPMSGKIASDAPWCQWNRLHHPLEVLLKGAPDFGIQRV